MLNDWARMNRMVRITHKPTGITAVASEYRSQHRNRDAAYAQLRSKVAVGSVFPLPLRATYELPDGEPCPDCTRWNVQPAQAGEPFGYFHQLLNHEGKGNGVWLGAAERKVVEQAHTPGETSEEIVTLYTAQQPTQTQPVAREPLTPERVKEIVRGAGYDQCGIPDTERAAFINGLRHGEQAHGIKVGQHGEAKP